GEKLGFVGESQEALELTREVGVGTVLDQRRGAYRAGLPVLSLGPPRCQQRLQDVGRDRLLVEGEPDLDRELARLRRRGGGKARQQIVQSQRRELRPVGGRREAEPAWRRQAGVRQRRQVRGLRSHLLGVGGGGIAEGEDEG